MPTDNATSLVDSLPLPTPLRSVHTPWGLAQDAIVHGDGIVLYHTASHGGICLSASRVQGMPPALRAGAAQLVDESGCAWFEEDLDWSMAVLAYPACFNDNQVAQAQVTLREWRPAVWEAFYGRELDESESYVKRHNAFLARHRNHLLVIAAWAAGAANVPDGKVGVLATRGARRGIGESFWLIDATEYETARDCGEFVIDPARHQRVTGPFEATRRPG